MTTTTALPDNLQEVPSPVDPESLDINSLYGVGLYGSATYGSNVAWGQFAAELWARLEPYTVYDARLGYALKWFVGALGVMFEEVEDLARDGADDEPGWSAILDPTRAPVKALVWLLQFVGVPFSAQRTDETDSEYATRLRTLIEERSGFERGTLASVRAAVLRTLTGVDPPIYITERWGSAYRLAIRTLDANTPDPAAVRAEVLRAAKPGGIVLDYASSDGPTYSLLAGAFASYDDVVDRYTDYDEVAAELP